jgi:Ni/Co efflux regulator RcnB
MRRKSRGSAVLLAVLLLAAAPVAAAPSAPAEQSPRESAREPAAREARDRDMDKDKDKDKDGRSDSAGESAAAAPRVGAVPDLARLRGEYDRIREELFKARARSRLVAETVYASKLDAVLKWKGSPDFVIKKARILLDGAEIWDSSDRGNQTDDVIQVSERAVKPGPHALTVRLEIRPRTEAKGGTKTGRAALGYTSEHTFAILVPETGRTHLTLTGDEDGDPPEYEPELELELETER